MKEPSKESESPSFGAIFFVVVLDKLLFGGSAEFHSVVLVGGFRVLAANKTEEAFTLKLKLYQLP